MPTRSMLELQQIAARVRLDAIQMVLIQGFGYLGQALSSAEIFTALFAGGFLREGRDRFVISPSHYVIGVYAAAAQVGRIPREALAYYGKDGAALEAIGGERTPVVNMVCGSLGQGLSVGVGYALAARLADEDRSAFAFLSDGELQEGQIWEATMFATHNRDRMGRLIAVIDANNSQVDGPVTSVTTLEPLADKWRAFGWRVAEVDGHDLEALCGTLESGVDGPPLVVIARTEITGGFARQASVELHEMAVDRGGIDFMAIRLQDRLVRRIKQETPPVPQSWQALLALARRNTKVVCLGADLTRQTETDMFRDAIGERFINAGAAEANMIGISAGLARAGHVVFVNTFGVFCTHRCNDQVAMAIAYPKLNFKIVGFMPGLSIPGGPSHQAIDDVALMRALPNMTVVEPADALEVAQAVDLIADHPGPVYMRLKRGETPMIFEPDHHLDLAKAQILYGSGGGDALIIAAGMMIPATMAAGRALKENGIVAVVVNAPVVKPLDTGTIVTEARRSRIVVTAENHTVIGGLGSAVAEALAEAGVPSQLRRIGVRDVFAESGSREYLFGRYGLGTQDILDAVWSGLAINLPPPRAPSFEAASGAYAPV